MSSSSTSAGVDGVTTEVVRHGLETIADEMRTALYRTARTVVVKDMLDYSCGLFDVRGRLIAAALDVPSLISSMGSGLRGALEKWGDDIARGDVIITNHPFMGASHTPDVFIFIPVFDADDVPLGWAGTIVHHADWGGRVPGTVNSASRVVLEEGVIYPAVKIEQAGSRNEAVYDLVRANVRNAELTLGDLYAQIAAARIGERRLQHLARQRGTETVLRSVEALLDYSAERTRRAIELLPDGTYSAEGFLDDDGIARDTAVRLAVDITIAGASIEFDFSRSAEQRSSSMNLPLATLRSAALYGIKCFVDDDIPLNEGCMEPVTIVNPAGRITNPVFPAAVGNRHPTSERLSDIIADAMGQALPERGSANWYCGWPYLICEARSPKTSELAVLLANISGGAGAHRGGDGEDALDCHLANCALIPAEVVETNYPLRVDRYELVQDSGGAGKFRGGLGIRADYRVVGSEPVVFQAEVEQSRDEFAARGLDGGRPGASGSVYLVGEDGSEVRQDPKSTFEVAPGCAVSLRAGGGGGYGPPEERDRGLVERDIRSGKVSDAAARAVYVFDREAGRAANR